MATIPKHPPPAAKKTAYGNQQDTTVKIRTQHTARWRCSKRYRHNFAKNRYYTPAVCLIVQWFLEKNDAGVEQNLIKDKVPFFTNQ